MRRARTNKENRPKRPSTLGLLLGGTGGRKDASKGAEAERQRRRRERDRSREMAAYVGYDAMYRDGIAQVMPGVFSQTVEFSDISYQSARKEARETAFTVMSSLFNYFPADSHVQLQVVNAPIPADEVGRKVFFEPGERATAGLAEEYNRILNDKMREGVSNLVRHRYLTYAVGADDVDAAVPKLARIRGDVEQTLARIRCSSRALDGVERLELLQGQLRPGSRFEFSWDKLSPTSGARTKDFVMPSTLDFKPEGRSDCFRSDGRYGAVLAVRSFGSVIEETYLASIIDLPLPLNVTLHVQPIAQSEALALVKRQIDWMDKEIIDEQMSAVKKGYDYQILPPELRFSKEEAEELLDFLRNKSERLFVYTGLVYTWADSLEELDRRVQQVTSVAQGCTIGLEPLHFRQRQALNSVLPLGDNHVTVSRYLTTGQVAMQMPFASQSLDDAASKRGLEGLPPYITYEMVEAALECQEEYGHPAGCTIAQIIQESGQGDRMSQLAERDHNLFGMKWWSGYAGCPEVAGKANWATSEEYVPGEHTQITASFIRFTGDAECIRFRSRVFLQAERYSGNALIREAVERRDSDRMAEGLKDAGWATDSSYVESLKSIMAQWGLYRLDSMTVEDLKDPSASGNAIVEAAYSQLGVPYVWGGSTPGKALDCSGLTQYCYAQAGIRISHYTGSQYEELRRIPLSEAKPGDILYRSGHVAIYIGDDRYIHEPRTGDVCRIASGIGSFSCALTAR